MSRYVSHIMSNNTLDTTSNTRQADPSKKSVNIASATQSPTFGQTVKQIAETKMVVTPNYNGGVSFSLPEVFRCSVKNNDTFTANTVAVNILERLTIFGTSDTRVDISATKLTD